MPGMTVHLRVLLALLMHFRYEWDAHSPILRESGVLSEDIIEKLKDREFDGSGLDEKHLAVYEYTNAMTIGVIVRDPLFKKVKNLFSEREVVELTATVAAYNTVSRFLVALDVGETSAKYGVDIS